MSQIKIGPIVYTVHVIERLLSEDDKSLYGQVKHSDCAILIEGRNAPQQQRETLWHEILHIILTQSGHSQQQTDEDLIEALAYGVMQVTQDHPWLAEEVE